MRIRCPAWFLNVLLQENNVCDLFLVCVFSFSQHAAKSLLSPGFSHHPSVWQLINHLVSSRRSLRSFMSFPPVFQIEEITFKNYYTAYVTVRLLRRSPGQEAPAKWCTALRDLPLMDNPHTEGGSQDYYSIHRTQMQAEADHVVSVRLILRQPSSAWLTFSLEDVKIFPHLEPVSVCISGLPDPQTVSSSIQQMWALTEVMQTNQTTASIGRFDVDGCYDINLLSLT
uniref:Nicolin-1-like n=1 Tax=Stegastes partitus TaxID=144197 RepID=A0A3B5AYA8_9TELE